MDATDAATAPPTGPADAAPPSVAAPAAARVDGPSYALVALFVGLEIAIHLQVIDRYDYFLDEVGFLSVYGRHFEWAYLTSPPMLGILGHVVWWLGGSLVAVRTFPMLAGVITVIFTMLTAWRLGGGRFAQALAGLAAVISPAVLVLSSLFTANIFELACSAGCGYFFITVLSGGPLSAWAWFGLWAGLALMSKYTSLICIAALVAGLLLTPQRANVRRVWFWVGVAITLQVIMPMALWQIDHHFKTLSMATRHKELYVPETPLVFIWEQIVAVHPMLLPVWVAGLVHLMWADGRRYRAYAVATVLFFVVDFVLHMRYYHLAPIYPVLFAAGAVAIERWLGRMRADRARFVRPAILGIVAVSGAVTAPAVLPFLSPENFLAYTRAIRYTLPGWYPFNNDCPLPQYLSDQFGLRELTEAVADVYHGLPADEQQKTTIFVREGLTYGVVNFFGPQLGLPEAITHEIEIEWSQPNPKGDTFICLTFDPEFLKRSFRSVEEHPMGPPQRWGNPKRVPTIYVCRGLRVPWKEFWDAAFCMDDGATVEEPTAPRPPPPPPRRRGRP